MGVRPKIESTCSKENDYSDDPGLLLQRNTPNRDEISSL
jgi:hypothetical protein